MKLVEKISAKNTDDFLYAYSNKRPVLIEDLLESSIEIDLTESSLYQNIKVEIMNEYSSHFASENTFIQESKVVSLCSYMDYITEHPDTTLCVREYNTPKNIIDKIGIPKIVTDNFSDEVTSNLFVANAGNKAQLHFDGDHRHVILYQVSGRKRGILFEPSSGNGLFPVLNQSWVNLEQLDDEQLKHFVAMNNGYIVNLKPGDALYFPMMMWHHFSYIDTGMSVNFRFGRKDNNDLLYRYVHADKYLQNLSWHIYNERSDIVDIDFIMSGVKSILTEFDESPVHKREIMRTFFKFLCEEYDIYHEENIYSVSEDEIINTTSSLNAISSQPYHFHNWVKYNNAERMLKSLVEMAS
ncbi:hypothetical protein AB835_11895 [Candidatus Endobugula sertula]|uniref:JmjC domain-containing protein n=1 Tax=Candidatus Endobugula sertula TaxID=62101 RepID=A0A1D2QMR3_9GAMM|nr:hypothetical protein AB835_11895 [Candidatus Endobugula sertula]